MSNSPEQFPTGEGLQRSTERMKLQAGVFELRENIMRQSDYLVIECISSHREDSQIIHVSGIFSSCIQESGLKSSGLTAEKRVMLMFAELLEEPANSTSIHSLPFTIIENRYLFSENKTELSLEDLANAYIIQISPDDNSLLLTEWHNRNLISAGLRRKWKSSFPPAYIETDIDEVDHLTVHMKQPKLHTTDLLVGRTDETEGLRGISAERLPSIESQRRALRYAEKLFNDVKHN